MNLPRDKRFKRQIEPTIIHFDYDCFYASVIEHERPELKTLPLAVQQKQIVVTCNYEARRRGLYKLQLITEAKKVCPDVIIVLGEDLTRFRDASKALYGFLRSFSWNSKCDRLGFDEVFMDVSDIIDYNATLLTSRDLENSWFCLSKTDPTSGFAFDASGLAGHSYPEDARRDITDPLYIRLLLGSHLAQYLRQRLESEHGYTATVGISTNKLIAKLVGNVHKPNSQTTLLPPYTNSEDLSTDNVTTFIDQHEIGKIPGIGFKTAQKLRALVLQRPADFDTGLVYGGTKENVCVANVRNVPGLGPEELERLLGGSGAPQGIGARVWDLINGCDDVPVGQARDVPTQISIEDSYIRLDTLDQIIKELRILSFSLLKRMHADLLETEEPEDSTHEGMSSGPAKRWMAHPRTLRLTTRPRPPQNPDGSRNRSFARISKSTSMPNFMFNLKEDHEVLVEKLIHEVLLPLFRRLHPEKSGWNLSLVNLAVANMVNAASDKGGAGRDIAKMFKRQDDVLRQFKVWDEDEVEKIVDQHENESGATREETRLENIALEQAATDQELHDGDEMMEVVEHDADEIERTPFLPPALDTRGSEDVPTSSQVNTRSGDLWEEDDEDMLDDDNFHCPVCGAIMPLFAMGAHERWHMQE